MSCQRTSLPESSGTIDLLNIVLQSILVMLCALLLTSCGPVKDYLGSAPATDEAGAQTDDQKNEADSASGDEEGSDEEGSAEKDAAAPPDSEIRPLRLGERGGAETPNGLPALQPRGVNLEELFAKELRSDNDRFERVENAVVEMRRDFDSVLPSILRLVAVEKDMQELMRQLNALLQNEPLPEAPAPVAEEALPVLPVQVSAAVPAPKAQAPPAEGAAQKEAVPPEPKGQAPPVTALEPEAADPQPEPEEKAAARPAPETPPQALVLPEKKDPSAPAGAVNVTGVRIGEHPDKTRIVIDLSGPATFRHDIDNTENLLVIEIPGTGWMSQKEWTSGKAPLLASWTMLPLDNGRGSRMIVQLKQAATVVYSDTLAAEGRDPHRIVIDLRRR